MMEALHSSETSVIIRAIGVTSQKTAFLIEGISWTLQYLCLPNSNLTENKRFQHGTDFSTILDCCSNGNTYFCCCVFSELQGVLNELVEGEFVNH
jgi:hypothetical protein